MNKFRERGLLMLAHASVFAMVAYATMVYGMGTSQSVAENKSMLVLSGVLAYMVLFGHSLPNNRWESSYKVLERPCVRSMFQCSSEMVGILRCLGTWCVLFKLFEVRRMCGPPLHYPLILQASPIVRSMSPPPVYVIDEWTSWQRCSVSFVHTPVLCGDEVCLHI